MRWYIAGVPEEEKRRPGRPTTTGTTPKRNLRVGEIWDEAEAIAKQRGETMADVARPILERGLRRYINKHRAEMEQSGE